MLAFDLRFDLVTYQGIDLQTDGGFLKLTIRNYDVVRSVLRNIPKTPLVVSKFTVARYLGG